MKPDHVMGNHVGVHEALVGLLRHLPRPGPWRKDEKERFKNAFILTLDFLYPDAEQIAVNPDGEGKG